MCVICMKCRIIILIIIIIRVGQLLSYIANTSHTPSPFRLSLFDGSLAPNRDGVNVPFRRDAGDQWPVVGSFK